MSYDLKLYSETCDRCFLGLRFEHVSPVDECSPIWLIFQLEEVCGVPASSEKAISEATARKEELEKQKVKEEKKLKAVMESLKEETSGLQQDKEVRVIRPGVSLSPALLNRRWKHSCTHSTKSCL